MGDPTPRSVHPADLPDLPDPGESLGCNPRILTKEVVPPVAETAPIQKREIVTAKVRTSSP
jgi:hypothetical protein